MSSIVNSLGAGSGIDITGLVDGLVEAERAPADQRLDNQQQELEADISAYGTFKSSLSEFESVIEPLSSADTYNARSVSFSETDALTPTELDSGAATGSYQLEVVSIATSQTLTSGSYASESDPVGAGTMTIRFGEWTEDGSSFSHDGDSDTLQIKIDESNNTLEGLRDAINAAGEGVQASIVYDGGSYRLMLSSESGLRNSMEISVEEAGDSPSNTDSSGLSALAFNDSSQNLQQTQSASDAELVLNGLELTRETNVVDDVITGLTFELNKSSEGEVINFSINQDDSIAEQAIRDFVEAYNLFYETTGNLTGIDPETGEKAALANEATAKTAVSQIRATTTAQVSGLVSDFNTLAQLGIETELDGTLSIDEELFQDALSNNFDQIEALFAPTMASSSSDIEVGLGSYAASAQPGQYEIEITQQPSKGSYAGEGVNSSLTSSGTFSLDTGNDSFSFEVTVDGVSSSVINLPADTDYASGDELASELQSLINGDDSLSATNVRVVVSYDESSESFRFDSETYGSNSNVSFSSTSSALNTLGISDGGGDAGTDVGGTINGKAGFGAGDILLPDVNADAYGLVFNISPGATSATVDFSVGVAGQLVRQVEYQLDDSGPIEYREDNINTQLDGIAEDREELDRKMALYEARLLNEYLAMEAILNSLSSSASEIDGLLASLNAE